MGAKRQPRYVLSRWIAGQKMYLMETKGPEGFYIYDHTTEPSMALFLTKYKADQINADLAHQYEVEPA